MIRRSLAAIPFALLVAGLSAQEEKASGQAVFANGDRLSGTPGAMDEQGLTWSADHPR